ncbi:MAG: TIGR03986 family CRISPR-associated RAMP protein [Chitinophagales bacterium]|nr:TIGR03986 family CRISPR-associated RAMP protein [Chitinophagales bacterium]
MKKGKVYFNPKNKAKYLILEDGKEIKLPKGYFKADIKAGEKMEVNYDESRMNNGIPFIEQILPKKNQNQEEMNPNPSKKDPARAPYNFVPLNEKIVSAQQLPDNVSFYEFDKTINKERYSGYIDLSITNKTHLYIRGTELKNGKWTESENFFRIKNDEPVIPGSSLRGLARTLVEIMSWSEMIFVDKKRSLFHRGMFNPSLKTAYQQERRLIPPNNPNAKKNETVGLLKFENGKYFIYPSDCQGECNRNHTHKYEFDTTGNFWKVSPGKAPGGANKGWKISLPAQNIQPIPLTKKVVDAYMDDETRGADTPNLLLCARKKNEFSKYINGTVADNIIEQGVPVFYQKTGNTISSFGYTRNYRIPYALSIGDHIQQNWIDSNNKIDLARAIFGFISDDVEANQKASRVFFEDSCKVNNASFESRAVTKELLAPKPTTFQHYLKQPNGYKTIEQQLYHWGTDGKKAPIRGNKGYWHRETEFSNDKLKSWYKLHPVPATYKVDKTNQLPIKALKPNAVFQQRLRFENLTSEELGALLFALELPDGCAHKLGMGKPLGLGSVHIHDVKLTLIDRKERYKKVFNDNGQWNTGESAGNTEDYKKSFAKYICNAIGAPYDDSKGANSLWEVDRLKELKTMLTLNNDMPEASVDWLSRTRYQELDEFKRRPVLPKPSEVIQPNTYNKK